MALITIPLIIIPNHLVGLRRMEQSRLHELEEQCIQDCDPPCTARCPVHVDIRQICKEITAGNFNNALTTLQKSIPFPEIIARTCDQPCQSVCNRQTLGGSVRVADLELACCQFGKTETPQPPMNARKNAVIAVIGAGLCGMTAARELTRKGYKVVLFDRGEHAGGQLWRLPDSQLPKDIILRESAKFEQTGIDLRKNTQIELNAFDRSHYDAVLIATGVEEAVSKWLEENGKGVTAIDAVTFETGITGVFCGGSILHPPSTVLSIADGKRTAISIDRYLQKVSLTASRLSEGAQETRLYTSLEGVQPVSAVMPTTIFNGYTPDEAISEARRCLLCDCMACVKVCTYLSEYGAYPRKYVRDIYNNLSIIMRQRRGNKFINSCTLCGLCGEVCPTDLNFAEVIEQTRKTMVETKKMPISAHDFALRDMAFSNSPRFAFTYPVPGKEKCDYLLFPGCQLAASNPEYISLIYDDLLKQVENLGIMLRCCGSPARWSGEEALFLESGTAIRGEWESLGKPKFILACSSCNKALQQIIPEVETISLWEILLKNEQLASARLKTMQEYKIHDPCSSRYEPEWQNFARAVIERLGIKYSELPMSRSLTECCGYGGVTWLANPDLAHKSIQRRINEDESDYLTYCVMCRDLFAAEGKPTLHLLDLIYGRDVPALAKRKPPDYSQRHENRIRIKQRMQKRLLGKGDGIMETYEKIKLQLSSEMRDILEARLILVEDIQKVIEHVETSGEYFINRSNGHSIASYKPNLITYWVEFTKQEDTYIVIDAYSHRMVVGGDTSL